MKSSEAKNHDTRERLIHAAGEVFAEYGFRAATVREISRRANANVAAVNYHFGDKKALYSTVLKSTLTAAVEKYPPDLGLKENATAEEALFAFIRSFLLRILDEGRPAWHGKLMAKEFSEPTAAFDELVESAVRPLHNRLASIVREVLGRGAGDELVRLCTMSIVGQCVFYHHSQPVIMRLHQKKFGPEDVDCLAKHIMHFSIGGLRDLSN